LHRTSVVICIATYQRPALLAQLLKSVRRASELVEADVRCVVVDNDPAGGAEDVVLGLARGGGVNVTYVLERRPGIAAARNAALAALQPGDEWLAFVDDDEVVDPAWLRQLLLAAADHSADVVAGPVEPVYPDGTPRWVERGEWHGRRRLPTGSPITWAATNNVLVRRAALERLAVPAFDESFGLTGGSDLEFFDRIRRSGARMVWCDAAVVSEVVPLQRSTPRWLVKRALRLGNVTGRLMVQRRGRFATLGYAGYQIAHGLLAVLRCVAVARRPAKRELWPLATAPGIALAACGWIVSEYGGRFLRRA
jgi:succinoglycan biosynthesis protein ExoM